MSEKLVHVNSYKRGDGTPVKEHYRGGGYRGNNSFVPDEGNMGGEVSPSPLGDCDAGGIGDMLKASRFGLFEKLKEILTQRPEDMTQNVVLEGGVSTEVYLPPDGGGVMGGLGEAMEAVQVFMALAQAAGGLAVEGLKVAAAIKHALDNFDELGAAQFGAEMDVVVGKLYQAQSQSLRVEQSMLDKLSQTTDQREYKQLYDTYVQQRDLNRATKPLINRIAYSNEHKNYEELTKGLQEYNTLHSNATATAEQHLPLNTPPAYIEFAEQPLSEVLQPVKIRKKTLGDVWREEPERQRDLIDGAMKKADSLGAEDTRAFWEIGRGNVAAYKDYVDRNGYFVDSISDLPYDIQDDVRAKVREQLHVSDAKGLILRPKSSLSRKIINSKKFQDLIKKSIFKLLSGQVVSGSLNYKQIWTPNIGGALGNADILNTYINPHGDIVSFVVDTYDFNAGEAWFIEWGRNVQQNGYLKGYFSVTILVIPQEQWLGWIIN